MKGQGAVALLLAAALLLCGCTSTKSTSSGTQVFTLEEMLGRMPPRDSLEARWVFSSLTLMGQDGVGEICNRLGAPGTDRTTQAENALQGLATYVVSQGSEADRLMFVSALGKALDNPLPSRQASFIIARLQLAGRSESIALLSRFLADERLCEPSAQAMVAIREGAGKAFLSALPGAQGHCRITMIKSLGELRSREAVELLLKDAASDDPRVHTAALSALANIGDPRADGVLTMASMSGPVPQADEATRDVLHFARRLVQAGNTARAIGICNEVYARRTSPLENHFRAASLDILVQAKGESAIDDLLGAMADSSTQLRYAALGLALRIPGEAVTGRWVTLLKTVRPEVRSEIVSMLGTRRDKSAYPAVIEALNDAEGSVRRAAVESAAYLKDRESVPVLLALLERSQDPGDVATVRKVLGQLPPAQVTSAAVESLPRLTPPACVMVMDLLGTYGTAVPAEPIVALAKSRQGPVRLAALKALGPMSREKDQPELIALLLGAEQEEERSAAQKSLVSLCSRITDPEKRADNILEAYMNAGPQGRASLLRVLGRIGGSKALATVAGETQSKDPDIRDAAIRALADWPTIDAYDRLLAIAKSKEQLNLRVLALRGCVRVVESGQMHPAEAVRYHEKTMAAAERVDEKRLVLGALANLRSREALKVVIPYVGDDSLGLDAAMAAGKISAGKTEAKDELGPSQVARTFIESRVPARFRSQVEQSFDAAAGMNTPPDEFKALFNGKNLNGWKGLVENPVARAKMTPEELAAAQARADSVMGAHWSVADGILLFDGNGESICTAKDYDDFEMLVDWKIEKNGDSGIYLRGSPQVQIWDPAQWPEGSGGLYNNQKDPAKPLRRADKPVGEWNTFRIRMTGERVAVYLNDVLVVDSVLLENYWDRSISIFPTGQIELQSHNSPLYFRNIFLREIPRSKPLFSGSLFNGVDLTGWKIVGGKEGTWGVSDGILFTTGDGGGWLSTEREYGNFQLDLDFRLPEGGNSGVFLRSPRQGDPAYTGMEIQILDDYAAQYAKLQPWQYCGSIYGVAAPTVRASKRANEWQHYRIVARGPRVTVTLNDQMIVDADLVAHMDKESSHPGLKRRSGFIGLQCHGLKVEYRNITLTQLEWNEKNDSP